MNRDRVTLPIFIPIAVLVFIFIWLAIMRAALLWIEHSISSLAAAILALALSLVILGVCAYLSSREPTTRPRERH